MAVQERPCLNLAKQTDAVQVLPEGPLLSSADANWRGFYLAQYCHGASETVEHVMAHHVLDVPEPGGVVWHERWVDGQRSRYQQGYGDLDFCPAGTSHRAVWEDQVHFVLLVIEPWFVERVMEEVESRAGMVLRPRLKLNEALLQQLVVALRDDLLANCPAGAMYGETLGRSLVLQLMRTCGEHQPPMPMEALSLSQATLTSVKDYVEANLDSEIRLEDLARVANLSPTYFCRCFKQAMGVAPHQFLLQRRIVRAKQLLNGRELSLVEVALACGFGSQSLLNRHFKRRVGVTPGQWRRLR